MGGPAPVVVRGTAAGPKLASFSRRANRAAQDVRRKADRKHLFEKAVEAHHCWLGHLVQAKARDNFAKAALEWCNFEWWRTIQSVGGHSGDHAWRHPARGFDKR